MAGNFDINKELLDAMRIIARQEIEKCNRDITKTARVINVNNDKTVKIEMDGKQYDNIPNYNGTTLSVNNIVKVTYPQGQASNMYVSGGGEDEIYSNLAGLITVIDATSPATTNQTVKVCSFPSGYTWNNSILIAAIKQGDSYKYQNSNINTYLKIDGVYMYTVDTNNLNCPCRVCLIKNNHLIP